MMRNTGAGPGEIGGLAVADVSLDSEVPYIWIRKNALRGGLDVPRAMVSATDLTNQDGI